jgi:predicted nucleic acid-binding protein
VVQIKHVVDTSIFIQGFLMETQTLRVMTLFNLALDQNVMQIHIPEFCLSECANIIWKRIIFQQMPLVDGQKIVSQLKASPVIIEATIDLMPRALEIGVQHRLAIYDSIYIALAEFLRCPLLTEDGKQADAAKAVGIQLKPITDFPEYTL